MEYKVGDTVRVREDLVHGKSYGNYLFVKGMWHLAGKTFRITRVDRGAGCYRIDCPGRFCWTDEMLEDVNVGPQEMDKHVIIYVDGNKVVARCGDKEGVARCHPDDDFDFYVGAKLALERLEEAEKPYGWLGRGTRYYVPKPTYSDYYDWREYHNNEADDRYKQRGLIFKTREEAIECAKKMLAAIKQESRL